MPRLPRVSGPEAVSVFERLEQHHRQCVDAVSALGAALITCQAASRRTKGRSPYGRTRRQEVKANLFDVALRPFLDLPLDPAAIWV